MIYYTGDIHGNPAMLVEMCRFYEMKSTDTLVILGDVGVNYSLDERDFFAKRMLNSVAPKVLCIHGNHEIRPNNIKSYKEKEWNGGIVWFEEHFPNLLFAKDGEVFNIEGKKHLVIGGAYSIDKSTEIWLDKIEENIDYKKWYCGHWHLEKKIDKFQFLFHNIAAQ